MSSSPPRSGEAAGMGERVGTDRPEDICDSDCSECALCTLCTLCMLAVLPMAIGVIGGRRTGLGVRCGSSLSLRFFSVSLGGEK